MSDNRGCGCGCGCIIPILAIIGGLTILSTCSIPGSGDHDTLKASAGQMLTRGDISVSAQNMRITPGAGRDVACADVTWKNVDERDGRTDAGSWSAVDPAGLVHSESRVPDGVDSIDGKIIASGATTTGSVCFDPAGGMAPGTWTVRLSSLTGGKMEWTVPLRQ